MFGTEQARFRQASTLSGMQSELRLLMRDGALQVAFDPHLTVDQYSELLERVNAATTKAELRRELKALAKKWGGSVETDSVLFDGV